MAYFPTGDGLGQAAPSAAPVFPQTQPEEQANTFASLESYPWSTDAGYQTGLAAILGPSPSEADPEQIEDLTLRARCFYFSRKYSVQVDAQAYKIWRQGQPPETLSSLSPQNTPLSALSSLDNTPSKSDAAETPSNGWENQASPARAHRRLSSFHAAASEPEQQVYPASFAEVMELIQSGKPVPGIKEIPDTVLVGQGTEARANTRRKPWEVERGGVESGNIRTTRLDLLGSGS